MSTDLNPDNRDDEPLLAELLREAGNPRVERTAAQISAIEQAIRGLEQPSPPEQKRQFSRQSRPLRRMLAAAASLLLIVTLAHFWPDAPAPQAWAQVAATVVARPWIHSVLHGPDNAVVEEIWFSPAGKIAAKRRSDKVVLFTDFAKEALEEYNPTENVIALRPIDENASDELRLLADVFKLILDGGDLTQWKRAEVIGQSRRDVKEEDRDWTEFEFTLRPREGQEGSMRLIFRVDPRTRLPKSLRVMPAEQPGGAGPVRFTPQFDLDYPATGPADIYALDVPKDAKIVDCGASADVRKVVKAVQDGQPKLDRYTAVIVPNYSKEQWWEAWNGFYRVYRKGDRWRVEQCFLVSPNTAQRLRDAGGPAGDVDHAKWWLAEANRRFMYPLEIFDGTVKYPFNYDFAGGADNGRGDLMPVLTAPPEATPVPSWLPRAHFTQWSNLLLELVGRPLMGIPSPHLADRIDLHPKTGPPDTVLLETWPIKAATMHGPGFAGGKMGLRRYWINPARNDLVVRQEDWADPEGREFPRSVTEIAKTGVTPQGQVYPLEVHHEYYPEAGSGGDHVYHFYIDFDSEVPDSLLEPPAK